MHVHEAAHLIVEQDVEDLELKYYPRAAVYLCCIAFGELIRIRLGWFDLKKANLSAWLEAQGVNIGSAFLLLVPNDDFSKAHTVKNVPLFSVSLSVRTAVIN